ncbi:MAG: transposase [Candidatus Micrarchaeota archaeon]|nr:transposase [Candidatus Micrarchaeota archaeon]
MADKDNSNGLEELLQKAREEEAQRNLTRWQNEEKWRKEEEMGTFLQEVLDAPPTSYPQDWPAYNEAQVQEKLLFLDLLADLCSTIEDNRQHGKGGGRPWLDLGETAFSCVSKVYEQLSSRRASSDLELAKRRGYLSRVPHFNSVLNYFNDEELTPILYRLIELSALPLRGFENTFAMDASGLSSAFYSRWLDYRFNEERRYHDWIKIHVAVGTKTQIVTAITVADGHSADCPQFPALFKQTAKNFNISAVCADAAYSSRSIVQMVWDAGAVPLIPFKKNANGKSRGSEAWRKMWLQYQFKKEQFLEHYHRRSLVESSFSALKRKFQGRLMLKSELGKVNEALAKILCYNICVLIHEAKKNGVEIDFKKAAQQPLSLHNNPRKSPR